MSLDMKRFVAGIHDYLEKAFAPVVKRMNAMEERLASLEAERQKTLADSYEGVHLAGKQYGRGCLVTHNGSLWMCLVATAERPGEHADWKMIVRAGRDAR